MDGITATKLIRAHEKAFARTPTEKISEMPSFIASSYTPIKIFAVTAGALEEEIVECINAGMDAVLIKPITRAELTEKLNTVRARML